MSEKTTISLFITFIIVASLSLGIYATKNDIKIVADFSQECIQIGGVVVATYTCINKSAILKVR